jgi:hypothetical protein
MITLEQIKLLEGKITKAIELIRVLKEENSTLRKGLESAQKRMRELESLVDGFKADQREIESVIVRTLHTLDELEESSAVKRQERARESTPAAPGGILPAAAGGILPAAAGGIPPAAPGGIPPAAPSAPGGVGGIPPAAAGGSGSAPEMTPGEPEPQAAKEELDIF